MSEYMNSARNCEVLADSVSINAAEECNRLAEENRRLKKWVEVAQQRADILRTHAVSLHNYLNPKIKGGK